MIFPFTNTVLPTRLCPLLVKGLLMDDPYKVATNVVLIILDYIWAFETKTALPLSNARSCHGVAVFHQVRRRRIRNMIDLDLSDGSIHFKD